MNQATNSKFAPAPPDDDNINKNIPTVPDSTDKTVNIFEGVAEYTMNESDNLKTVKIKAKNIAQDKLIKKTADYVNGFLKDRLLTLPDDEFLSVANEIYKITDVKYNFIDSDDNLTVRAIVTAQIDDNDIMNYVIKCFNEREELKSQVAALRKEIEDLKRQNESIRKENEDLRRKIAKITPQIISKDKIALANQKSEEAYRLFHKEDYEVVIKLYDEVIKLIPYFEEAYYYRGSSYSYLGQHERAIQDFNKAIQLNPNYEAAYFDRGMAYQELKQYKKAIKDYDKVLQFNPNSVARNYREECIKAMKK